MSVTLLFFVDCVFSILLIHNQRWRPFSNSETERKKLTIVLFFRYVLSLQCSNKELELDSQKFMSAMSSKWGSELLHVPSASTLVKMTWKWVFKRLLEYFIYGKEHVNVKNEERFGILSENFWNVQRNFENDPPLSDR